MKKNILTILIATTITISGFTQKDTVVVIHEFPNLKLNSEKDSGENRPVQFTFFYPIGSNGIQSPQIENNFSMNALYGVNGGVDGAEIGGLVNVNNGDVNGFQVGGIANITKGSTNGTIISGIANVVTDSSKGILIAGISNVVGDSSAGFHIAGISNTVNGTFDGGQIAGIGNLNNGAVNGFQIGGISNVTNGDFNGFQLSGIANISHGKTSGAQVGFINYAKHMNGLQLGFLNVAGESENVIPIGFLSIVKNGYHALEISAGESIYGNVALKLGAEKFYNSFRFGLGSYKGDSFLSYGYGIGTLISFNEKNKMALDISANTIVDNFWNNWDLDLLSRIELTYQRNLGEYFTVFGGPAFNVYVTEAFNDGEYGSINVPYTLYTEDWSSGNVSMWVGFQAGAAFRF
ncbi:MAG: hypothetical protein IPH24_15815 [Crocinitomicaceae bacterium]|nr:hypothetical protein [Crocinitomicaceae bacterium]